MGFGPFGAFPIMYSVYYFDSIRVEYREHFIQFWPRTIGNLDIHSLVNTLGQVFEKLFTPKREDSSRRDV